MKDGRNCPDVQSTLVVVVVRYLGDFALLPSFSSPFLNLLPCRNPYDWALAMHKNCFCRLDHLQEVELHKSVAFNFSKFLLQPWTSDTFNPNGCANIMEVKNDDRWEFVGSL